MKKTYLLAPGPTPIPESVLAVFSQPIIHHRTPAFEKVIENVRSGLKYLYQTKQEVLILAASGTGAMDASVTNLFSPGEKVIVVNAGKFGERWSALAYAGDLSNREEVGYPCGLRCHHRVRRLSLADG
jgi:aspartate aminotransferase-like enzyme